MAKAQKRQHSWIEDPASGVRRSAPRGQKRVSRAVLVSFAALLLASVWLWSRPGEDVASSNARIVVRPLPLLAVNAIASSRPTAASSEVELELSAWPREARLLLDGAPLPANPYRARVPADDGLHVLRAVAPGLLTQERAITFDRDRALTLTLQHPAGFHVHSPHAGRSARAEAMRARPSYSDNGAPIAPRPRTRVIYEEDPYR